jgi:monoterpene epsilon-lactone hydrolase
MTIPRYFSDRPLLARSGHSTEDRPCFAPDLTGLPPAIFTSGTRDLLLSDTVRAYWNFRRANVGARLQVVEALSYKQYFFALTAPETKEIFIEIGRFFDSHLKK